MGRRVQFRQLDSFLWPWSSVALTQPLTFTFRWPEWLRTFTDIEDRCISTYTGWKTEWCTLYQVTYWSSTPLWWTTAWMTPLWTESVASKCNVFKNANKGRKLCKKLRTPSRRKNQTPRQRSHGTGLDLRPFGRVLANLNMSSKTSSSSWSRPHILKSHFMNTLVFSRMEFHIP